MMEEYQEGERPPGEAERAALEARIAAKLRSLDELTLARLEQWVEGTQIPPREKSERAPSTTGLSRRQFLSRLAVGGGLVVVSSTATALIALDQGKEKGAAQIEARLMPEITRLQDLIALYQRLEKVDLDNIIKGGMAAFGLVLRAARAGGQVLGMGLDIAEAALAKVEAALSTLKEGVEFVESLVDRLQTQLQALWSLLGEVTGVVIPIAESIAAFFKSILDKIPFGIGAKIRQIVDWIQDLIAQLPEGLAHIKARLLRPLRAEWLDEEGGQGLTGRLIKPLHEQVLDPARQLVAEIEHLGSEWETQIQQPVEAALQERAAIRAEIARYEGPRHLP